MAPLPGPKNPIRPKDIVLCFDGATNQYSKSNTNVIKFFSMLDKSRPRDQIVYYQPGIGTYLKFGALDKVFTWYVHEHIMQGYRFLMQNYRKGDKICIFGFSRGAYTARSLVAFLDKVGLLPRDNDEQIQFAYNLHISRDKGAGKLAGSFKRTFCTHVTIEFLGVWDAVASVGSIYNRAPRLKHRSSAVKVARHALSLDERRARFQPCLFIIDNKKDIEYQSKWGVKNPPRFKFLPKRWGPGSRPPSSEEEHLIPRDSSSVSDVHQEPEPQHFVSTELPSVLEVWFAGCHADVGGGATEEGEDCPLSDITLRWMVKQVKLSGCGILFDPVAVRKAGLEDSTVGFVDPAVSNGWEGPGAEIEILPTTRASSSSSVRDDRGECYIREGKLRVVEEPGRIWGRNTPVKPHDQLELHPLKWFILEIIPTTFLWQDAKGVWQSEWGPNRWRGRKIRQARPYFHTSVIQRMSDPACNYKPRADWTPGTELPMD